WSYDELAIGTASFSHGLADHGLSKGDRVLIWGENRPEWLAAFWGAVALGIEVVPVDFRFSVALVQRISVEVKAKALVHGNSVDADTFRIERIGYDAISALPQSQALQNAGVSADDVVEIVY